MDEQAFEDARERIAVLKAMLKQAAGMKVNKRQAQPQKKMQLVDPDQALLFYKSIEIDRQQTGEQEEDADDECIGDNRKQLSCQLNLLTNKEKKNEDDDEEDEGKHATLSKKKLIDRIVDEGEEAEED